MYVITTGNLNRGILSQLINIYQIKSKTLHFSYAVWLFTTLLTVEILDLCRMLTAVEEITIL